MPTIRVDSNDYISEMCELGGASGTDKSPLNTGQYRHAYTPIYNFLFASIRHAEINLAEIGIAHGAGLKMYREFFPNAQIVGLDLHDSFIEICDALGLPNTRLMKTDTGNKAVLQSSFEQLDCLFDIIIDDGCHRVEHQVNTIDICLRFLKPGGTLVIEDLFRDERAPEEFFVSAITRQQELVRAAYFVLPINDRVHTADWNNEKLLVVVKD